MASYLNAPTSGPGGLVMQGDASGVLQLQAAGNTVATLTSSGPNAGIQVASYAAPAFSAYYTGSGQTINSGTDTLITINTKEFDTAGAFNNKIPHFKGIQCPPRITFRRGCDEVHCIGFHGDI